MDDLIGSVALSLCGKDSGKMLVIIAQGENGCVTVANGRTRRLEKPKKKKLRHLRLLGRSSIEDISAVTNKQLRKALTAFELQYGACATVKEE